MAQGLQRSLDSGGRVQALREPSQQLAAALGPSTLVFLSGGWVDGGTRADARRGAPGPRVRVRGAGLQTEQAVPLSRSTPLHAPCPPVLRRRGD